MSGPDNTPHWEIHENNGNREFLLRGDWNLLAIARAGRPFAKALRELGWRASDGWNLREIGALDSAGALLLWRTWGRQYPDRLQWRDDQQSWFEHLEELPSAAAGSRFRFWTLLTTLGGSISRLFTDSAGILVLLGQLMVDMLYCVRNPRAIPWRGISATVYKAGAQSLILLAFIGGLVGIVLAYQMSGQLEQFGANSAIISVVGLAFLRELGPFLTALILVGRSGSTFTAGIGAMRVTEEIDALQALGVSPTLRIVLPKVAGLTLAMPLLVIWTDFAGAIGAIYVSETKLGVNWGMWLHQFPSAIPWANYFIGVGKGVLFGGLIGLVSSYYGLRVKPNTQSLSEFTTRSVVVGLALVIAIDGAMGIMLSNVGLH
ncbi:MAG TPA: ABC transporter permease [Gammaproteobacteria bacterium]|nr:ABC transporter permease [Gammaproteobacteria bacterium]